MLLFSPTGFPIGQKGCPVIVLNSEIERSTDIPALNPPAQLSNAVAIAECEGNLVNLAAQICGPEHFVCLFNIKRERFLTENMLAMAKCRNRLLGMKCIGASHCDRIQIIPRAHLFIIQINITNAQPVGYRLCPAVVRATQGYDFGLRMRLQPGDMTRLNELTCSDHPDTQFRVIHLLVRCELASGWRSQYLFSVGHRSVSYGSAITFGTRVKSVTCKKSRRLVAVA